MKNMTNIKVLRDDVEWSTRFDGKITEVEVDGQKIMEIHTLVKRCEFYFRVFASVCVIAVLAFIGLLITLRNWIPTESRVDAIQSKVNDTNARVTYMIDVKPNHRLDNPYNPYTPAFPTGE